MKALWIVGGLVGATAIATGGYLWAMRNVETPEYTVISKDGQLELRRYPELVLATVTRRGDRSEAVRSGFGPLASYIFAKERGGDTIAMTAPVRQVGNEQIGADSKIAMTAPVTQTSTDQGWTISFIMPSQYTLDDLPAPAGDVTLTTLPARDMAAVRFSGRWTDDNFASAQDKLLDWVVTKGMKATGPVEYAYYNDPFTPFFMRRNEVMVPVTAAD